MVDWNMKWNSEMEKEMVNVHSVTGAALNLG